MPTNAIVFIRTKIFASGNRTVRVSVSTRTVSVCAFAVRWLSEGAQGVNGLPRMLGLSIAFAAETMRPEIGTPLQQAQALMKQGKNKEALAKVNEADRVGNKTANESYTIERVRAAAASAAGDNDAAAKSFKALIGNVHGWLTAA